MPGKIVSRNLSSRLFRIRLSVPEQEAIVRGSFLFFFFFHKFTVFMLSIFISCTFYFPFVSTSLGYITIPQNIRKIKINYNIIILNTKKP